MHPPRASFFAWTLSLAVAPHLLADEGGESGDPYAKRGNLPPRIEPLTDEQRASILEDVKVAEGFEVTVFAAPPAVNYPVFVAAAPDGTLYVSSDGNGSLGRDPERGRVIRLRDLDGDGQADETKVYCEVDAPRGLVWDRDRLYLVHPPHLSAFIDHDGDGVSDEQKVLVRDIAFGYADRPADHTTNGLSLGMDGWLYIAGGDFGFMKATGADGRTLQHRGGGVIRVRPDGTGLERFSTGTRNILEVAISPRMDLFARDNTNDGGGWDVRFHHLTVLADHGYPRLYKNFPDECITPIADYGGGSGCGAVYIDEPGFGEWNDAPFTADWGTGALYHHALEPEGATFRETRAPEPFIRMTRTTDADVDAMGNVYAASWKGATFKWEGADVGYVVRVRPRDFAAEPLPDFASLGAETLKGMLTLEANPSYRRRLEAVRELQRRDIPAYEEIYLPEVRERRSEQRNRLDDFSSAALSSGDEGSVEVLLDAAGTGSGVIQHTAIRALGRLGDSGPVFKRLDKASEQAEGLGRALALMHTSETVNGLVERIDHWSDSLARRHLLAALCRLHFHEGEWNGNSWGTRPDTRGPYYQPEPWSETPRIGKALDGILEKASSSDAAFLVEEMARNRIRSEGALQRLLVMATEDPGIVPEAVKQLASAEALPDEATPFLKAVILSPAREGDLEMRSQAIAGLARTDSEEAVRLVLSALATLSQRVEALRDASASDDPEDAGEGNDEKGRQLYRDARGHLAGAMRAFSESPTLENHHLLVEKMAARVGEPEAVWADAALLALSSPERGGGPEARELSAKALEEGWATPARRAQIIDAAAAMRHRAYGPRILAALSDPDADVRAAAERAAGRLRLKRAEDDSPKLADLSADEAMAYVMEHEGDVAVGESVFARATCNLCHTVSAEEVQRGPYLGNIAQTYPRRELAQNILDPNQTIAQGFASELFTMKDGGSHLGFVTLEGAETVVFRNATGAESTINTAQIATREKLPLSLMPPGLMMPFTAHEFASLLSYLESLAAE